MLRVIGAVGRGSNFPFHIKKANILVAFVAFPTSAHHIIRLGVISSAFIFKHFILNGIFRKILFLLITG